MRIHQMNLRRRVESENSGFYRGEKIIQPFLNPIPRVIQRKKKIPRVIFEFVSLLGSELVRNLKATGISGRSGLVKISKNAAQFLKDNFGVKKKVWTPAQSLMQEFSIVDVIYRNGDPKDPIVCSNLELKLGYETKNDYFCKNSLGEIVLKSFNEKQNVYFKFDRNIPQNHDDSLEQLIQQQNAANGI
jgi:hypothetical protein